jgi:hypothetical protein
VICVNVSSLIELRLKILVCEYSLYIVVLQSLVATGRDMSEPLIAALAVRCTYVKLKNQDSLFAATAPHDFLATLHEGGGCARNSSASRSQVKLASLLCLAKSSACRVQSETQGAVRASSQFPFEVSGSAADSELLNTSFGAMWLKNKAHAVTELFSRRFEDGG